jgi:hypothetical protein
MRTTSRTTFQLPWMRRSSGQKVRATAGFQEQRAHAAAPQDMHKSVQQILPQKLRSSRVRRVARLFLNAAVNIRRAVASAKPQARLHRLTANNGGGCRAAKASWKSRDTASRTCRETSPRSLRAFRRTKGRSAPATSPELVYDKALHQDSHPTKRTAIRRKISGTMIRSGGVGQTTP